MEVQTKRVLDYIDKHGSITQDEAKAALGVSRLASRIWDIRHSGIEIRREMVTGKNRYGEPVSYARYMRNG